VRTDRQGTVGNWYNFLKERARDEVGTLAPSGFDGGGGDKIASVYDTFTARTCVPSSLMGKLMICCSELPGGCTVELELASGSDVKFKGILTDGVCISARILMLETAR
jgi:hypothetical protein